MRPGAPLSPGLTEKTRYKPAWFTSDGEVSQRSFRGSRGPVRGTHWTVRRRPRKPGPGRSPGAVRLADAPPEGPVEDLQYLGRAGDGPDLAVGRPGYLLQVAEVLRHAEDNHEDLHRAARV